MHFHYFISNLHDGCHAGQVLERFYYDTDPLVGFQCMNCNKKVYDEDEELAKIAMEAHIVHYHKEELMEEMKEDE